MYIYIYMYTHPIYNVYISCECDRLISYQRMDISIPSISIHNGSLLKRSQMGWKDCTLNLNIWRFHVQSDGFSRSAAFATMYQENMISTADLQLKHYRSIKQGPRRVCEGGGGLGCRRSGGPQIRPMI